MTSSARVAVLMQVFAGLAMKAACAAEDFVVIRAAYNDPRESDPRDFTPLLDRSYRDDTPRSPKPRFKKSSKR